MFQNDFNLLFCSQDIRLHAVNSKFSNDAASWYCRNYTCDTIVGTWTGGRGHCMTNIIQRPDPASRVCFLKSTCFWSICLLIQQQSTKNSTRSHIIIVVDCSVENLTCVGKTGFWISRRIFSLCCGAWMRREIKFCRRKSRFLPTNLLKLSAVFLHRHAMPGLFINKRKYGTIPN
jgi:hypothetical protein